MCQIERAAVWRPGARAAAIVLRFMKASRSCRRINERCQARIRRRKSCSRPAAMTTASRAAVSSETWPGIEDDSCCLTYRCPRHRSGPCQELATGLSRAAAERLPGLAERDPAAPVGLLEGCHHPWGRRRLGCSGGRPGRRLDCGRSLSRPRPVWRRME